MQKIGFAEADAYLRKTRCQLLFTIALEFDHCLNLGERQTLLQGQRRGNAEITPRLSGSNLASIAVRRCQSQTVW